MLAILAAIVFGFALLIDLLDTNFGAPDLFNVHTLLMLGLLLLSSTWPASAVARAVAAAVAAVAAAAGTGAGARVEADRNRSLRAGSAPQFRRRGPGPVVSS